MSALGPGRPVQRKWLQNTLPPELHNARPCVSTSYPCPFQPARMRSSGSGIGASTEVPAKDFSGLVTALLIMINHRHARNFDSEQPHHMARNYNAYGMLLKHTIPTPAPADWFSSAQPPDPGSVGQAYIIIRSHVSVWLEYPTSVPLFGSTDTKHLFYSIFSLLSYSLTLHIHPYL